QDISMLNKMGAMGSVAECELIDLSVLVSGMLQDVSLDLESHEMTVENELPKPLLIRGNVSMVYSIFRNLIDNSISYAGKGTTIAIRCFRIDDKFVYLSFSDNGVGVEDKYLNRLFERFYRIDKGRSRKLGGTGLGLSIVKNAIILHGGTVSVKNRVEGGLEFIFTLKR
ncbi:MAG: two-component sensor histidine kinase, partial [Paludibacteraceae bacterium]|nr:two-component sensor histidine kinase [Paludibacteraceae bacterium]